MDTKASTELYLLKKCPPIFTSSGKQGFKGSYPPTGEQILLQFHGYHKYLQQVTSRQSSTNDAMKLVIKDIIDWWNYTGIELKSFMGISYMVSKIREEFQLRKRFRQRITGRR